MTMFSTPALGSVKLLAQAEVPSRSLFDYIAAGGPIGVVIILLSFVALGFSIAAFIRIRLARLAPPEQVERLTALLSAGRARDALEFARAEDNDTFLTRVVGGALVRCSRSAFGFLEIKAALEEVGQQQTARLHRSTDPIGVVAAVAPMLGLLGTVVGMVGAFDTISQTEGVARPDQLAGSISVALVTTVMGLVVAIPCTVAFAFLRNRIDHCVTEIAAVAEELAAFVESQAHTAAGAQAPRPATPTPPRPPAPNRTPQAGARPVPPPIQSPVPTPPAQPRG